MLIATPRGPTWPDAVLQTERMAMLFIDVLRSCMRAKKFKVHEFVVMPEPCPRSA